MTDHDPYGGLPSLEKLEGEVRELAIRSNEGWICRNWRRLTAVGAVLAIGVAVSPAGPAFGGPDDDRDGGIRVPIASAECGPVHIDPMHERDFDQSGSAGFSGCIVPACPPLERLVESRPKIAAIARDHGPVAAIEAAGCEPPALAEEALPGIKIDPADEGATGPDGPRGAATRSVPAPLATCVGQVSGNRSLREQAPRPAGPPKCAILERPGSADALR